ncbi:HpcH/HpaI aldolase/citrate lyase family protein [Williamsia sterculiae]|uniref:Citrate lyase subunit beta / citryl-CoA lyase n=1 Tax=Williamsia sterculiae TaxID=1344003 RepID=A0A1N7DIN0_9NOCA|nr:CoA ester lyase [Williamsia sterculiae]SIR75644.1 citrate lyase subunit beta / citryl-CoA lyase [Williamsia sterculiae]
MSNWTPGGPALLFCPADRPDRYRKAADRADVVILDLEDAVTPADREAARQALVDNPLDPDRTIVRVNGADTGDHARDLRAIARTDYRVLMLAKAESARHVVATGHQVIALIETPTGAVNALDVASAANCIGLMWGAEDLVAGLGGRSSRFGPGEADPGAYRHLARHVRSQVRLAAAAHDRFAVDSVHLDIGDVDGLRAEVLDAVALGYQATACIHPSQVDVVRAGYQPSDDEYRWATEVVAEAAASGGVFTFDGRMIDGPVIRQAEAIISRRQAADLTGASHDDAATSSVESTTPNGRRPS